MARDCNSTFNNSSVIYNSIHIYPDKSVLIVGETNVTWDLWYLTPLSQYFTDLLQATLDTFYHIILVLSTPHESPWTHKVSDDRHWFSVSGEYHRHYMSEV